MDPVDSAEKNAALQLPALRLGGAGGAAYLTDDEALAAAETSAGQLTRAWEMWGREV